MSHTFKVTLSEEQYQTILAAAELGADPESGEGGEITGDFLAWAANQGAAKKLATTKHARKVATVRAIESGEITVPKGKRAPTFKRYSPIFEDATYTAPEKPEPKEKPAKVDAKAARKAQKDQSLPGAVRTFKEKPARKAPSAAQVAARARFAAAAKARAAAKAAPAAEPAPKPAAAPKAPTVRKAAPAAAPAAPAPKPAAPAAPGTVATSDAAVREWLRANPAAKTPDVVKQFRISINRAAALVGEARGSVKAPAASSARTVTLADVLSGPVAPAAPSEPDLSAVPMDF